MSELVNKAQHLLECKNANLEKEQNEVITELAKKVDEGSKETPYIDAYYNNGSVVFSGIDWTDIIRAMSLSQKVESHTYYWEGRYGVTHSGYWNNIEYAYFYYPEPKGLTITMHLSMMDDSNIGKIKNVYAYIDEQIDENSNSLTVKYSEDPNNLNMDFKVEVSNDLIKEIINKKYS